MKSTKGHWRRGLPVLRGFTLALALSGCSMMIVQSGVATPAELNNPQTRAAVRDVFGRPDETGTCPDGRFVEYRWFRRRGSPVWEDVTEYVRRDDDPRPLFLALFHSPIVEVVAIAVQAYRSGQAKLHHVSSKGPTIGSSSDIASTPPCPAVGGRSGPLPTPCPCMWRRAAGRPGSSNSVRLQGTIDGAPPASATPPGG